MLSGFDWPHNIAACHDCGRLFCASPGCEPVEAGLCKQCRNPLCGPHYHEAVMERRAVCATCAVPRIPDPEEPVVSPELQDPTRCKNGHLWSEVKTWEWGGVRQCGKCATLRKREYRARDKARKAEEAG